MACWMAGNKSMFSDLFGTKSSAPEASAARRQASPPNMLRAMMVTSGIIRRGRKIVFRPIRLGVSMPTKTTWGSRR